MKAAENSSTKKKSIKFFIIIGIISSVITEYLIAFCIVFCFLLYIVNDKNEYFSSNSNNIAESKQNGYFISEYVVDESTKNQEHISIRGIDEVFLERLHYSPHHKDGKIITSDRPDVSLICTYKDCIKDSIDDIILKQSFTSKTINDKHPFEWNTSDRLAQSCINYREGDTIFVIYESKRVLIEQPIDSFLLIRKKQ